MSGLDDLRAAGFSQDEVNQYAAQKRERLLSAGFSVKETDDYLGNQRVDNASGDKTLARNVSAQIAPQTPGAIPPTQTETPKSNMWAREMWAAIQAGANTASSMTGGLAGMVYGALEAAGGNLTRSMVGEQPIDVEQNAMQRAQQWTPELPSAWQTDLGKDYTNQVGQWLAYNGPSIIGIGPELALLGHAMKIEAPYRATQITNGVSALPEVLRSELSRRIGGQILNGDDFRNVAHDVTENPAEVPVVEKNMRAIFDKTGIGPFTLADLVKKDPEVEAALVKGEMPKALERYAEPPEVPTEEPAEAPTAEPTTEPPKVAEPPLTIEPDKPWSEQPEAVRDALADHVNEMSKTDLVDIRKRQSVLASLLECLQ